MKIAALPRTILTVEQCEIFAMISAGSRPACLKNTNKLPKRLEILHRTRAREGLREGNRLERSLALRGRELSGQLRLGVRKAKGKFEARAWIEFNGAVLNDSKAVHRHYKPFERDLASLQMETR